MAISPFQSWQTDKREIASQARNDKMCHREGRSDLGCSGMANREKRDCDAVNSVIASGAWRSRFFRAGKPKREIASQARLYLSPRGTWRSRFTGLANREKKDCFAGNSVIARDVAISPFQSWQTEKREIASQARNDKTKARSNLAFSELANRQKRDCFAGSPLSVIARNEAISLFQSWQTDQREIATLRSQ